MRDILFRGKRRDNGEWVYGWYAPTFVSDSRGPHMAMITAEPYEYVHIGYDDSLASTRHYAVDLNTVGQYTGLLDKNGKELFEGDIVLGKDQLVRELEIRGYIGHQNGSFVIVGDIITHYRWIDYEVEVIGNIHDNPELLEEEE